MALHEWMPLAQAGDAQAQFNLGMMYAAGDGTPPDTVEAARWVRLAANQGHAEAQNSFGYLYEIGVGVTQDHEEAARWYIRCQAVALKRSKLALPRRRTSDQGSKP